MAELVYPPVVRVALGLFRALDLRIDIVGQENVPKTGGGVVVMNHTGYLDFALAGIPFWREHRRLVRFMAKQEVFHHKVSGPLMRGMHHIPVDRRSGGAAFRTAVAALKAGELVGVFPEATISRSFCLKEFKHGAARMAMDAGVPLLPMALWGSQRVLTKGRKRDFKAARHTPVLITVGKPLHPQPGESRAAVTERLRLEIEQLLLQTQARYPDRPKSDDDRWWLPAHLGGTAPTPEEAAAIDAAEWARRSAEREAERGG
jgi:1-acyl-sn-glycerol-3-phosphate acyltransferase